MDGDDAEALGNLIGCVFGVVFGIVLLVVIIHFAAKYW